MVVLTSNGRHYALLCTVLLIAGCASIPNDRGLSDIQAQLNTRGAPQLPLLEDARSAQLIDDTLNHTPLTSDDAVRIALIANPKLRSDYAKLGLSGAEVYNAGRLSNPTFSASILFGGAGNQTIFGLAQNFTDVLLLPARSRLAQGEFERVKREIGSELIEFANGVTASYYRLVGAQQVAGMRAAVATAAQTSATLAQRFFDAGNMPRLELELNQAEASQAQLDALAAQSDVDAARADLNQRMGLTADRNGWTVAPQLPAPVNTEDELATLQNLADNNRLDLDAARREVALLEDAYGVSRKTRLLGDTQIGIETERETDGSHITGPNLSLQLPLFHQGQGNVLHARSQLELSRAALDALRIEISNAVQLAHARVATARSMVEHYQQDVLPLRERIVKHTQAQANYMLIGQFELIRAKQQEYDALQKALEAVRDYWLARVELTRAIGSRLPSDSQIQPFTPSGAPVADDMMTSPPAGDHSHHH